VVGTWKADLCLTGSLNVLQNHAKLFVETRMVGTKNAPIYIIIIIIIIRRKTSFSPKLLRIV
jgi:hypothetical protein